MRALDRTSLKRCNVVDDGLAPAVNVHPCSVSNAILVRGDVYHIALAVGCRDTVMRLLIGDDDDAVVLSTALRLNVRHRRAEIGSTVRLACFQRIA